MFIQRENLTIRNATMNDAALLSKWWNDGRIMAHHFRCIEDCPARAIRGKAFDPEADPQERLIPELCDQYQNQVRSRFGKRVCGMCLAVCPWGKPRNRPEGKGGADGQD
jgi:hypothetical protein